GSGGIYCVISLKDKSKYSIVVENQEKVGGHSVAYIDPATSSTINIGIRILYNSVVNDHMS
ncbi:hypothetical protein COCCADRAFT_110801, partial [Bipolaris zeicola 26-R-13]